MVLTHVVVLLQDNPTLGVSQDGPGNAGLLQLLDRYLTGEGAVGLIVDVLGGDLDALAKVFTGKEQVEGGWGNHDLCGMM